MLDVVPYFTQYIFQKTSLESNASEWSQYSILQALIEARGRVLPKV